MLGGNNDRTPRLPVVVRQVDDEVLVVFMQGSQDVGVIIGQFWNGVDWDYWESREDRRCQNCAMHSGFEASAVIELRRNPRDMARMVKWN